MPNTLSLIGKRFGRWQVISQANSDSHGRRWNVLCDCGEVSVVRTDNLRNKTSKSCGCLQREIQVKRLTKHGMTKDRFFKIWLAMRARCLDPKQKTYKNYGGKGVKICDRWMKFENFYADMHAAYESHEKEFGRKNTSIDRIDPTGDYCQENCRWADRVTQANNTRKTKRITWNSETHTIPEWSRITGIVVETLWYRFKQKMSTRVIFAKPGSVYMGKLR